MIFQHTIDKVLSGEKTQTRRLVKVGEFAANQYGLWIPDLKEWHRRFADLLTGEYVDNRARIVVKIPPARDKYVVQNSYAVQSGRGQTAIARMRIIDINREDVRNISDKDVQAEGFENPYHFWETWTAMHDKRANSHLLCDLHRRDYVTWGAWAMDYSHQWCEYMSGRPAEQYDAWALTFELAQP